MYTLPAFMMASLYTPAQLIPPPTLLLAPVRVGHQQGEGIRKVLPAPPIKARSLLAPSSVRHTQTQPRSREVCPYGPPVCSVGKETVEFVQKAREAL